MTHPRNLALYLTAIIVLAAQSVSIHAQAASLPSQSPSFSISISPNQTTAKLGDRVVIAIDLKNLSNSTVKFEHTGTTQAESIFNIEMHDSLGNLAPFTQYCKAIKGIDQGPGPTLVITSNIGYASVEPQQSFKATREVSKCFALQPGVYTVQASFTDPTAKRIVASNTIEVTITK